MLKLIREGIALPIEALKEAGDPLRRPYRRANRQGQRCMTMRWTGRLSITLLAKQRRAMSCAGQLDRYAALETAILEIPALWPGVEEKSR